MPPVWFTLQTSQHALTKLYFRVEPVKSTCCKRVLQTMFTFTNYVSVFYTPTKTNLFSFSETQRRITYSENLTHHRRSGFDLLVPFLHHAFGSQSRPVQLKNVAQLDEIFHSFARRSISELISLRFCI